MAKVSVASLNSNQKEKWLKFGRRGYELCAQTLHRLVDFDQAIYNSSLDLFFENAKAQSDFLLEQKIEIKKKKVKKFKVDTKKVFISK